MLYANVYVGLAVLAMNLIQASQEQSATAGLFEQLAAISKQIEELRKEMHERFDALDYKADHYFEKTYVDVENIDTNVSLAMQELASLRRDRKT